MPILFGDPQWMYPMNTPTLTSMAHPVTMRYSASGVRQSRHFGPLGRDSCGANI